MSDEIPAEEYLSNAEAALEQHLKDDPIARLLRLNAESEALRVGLEELKKDILTIKKKLGHSADDFIVNIILKDEKYGFEERRIERIRQIAETRFNEGRAALESGDNTLAFRRFINASVIYKEAGAILERAEAILAASRVSPVIDFRDEV